MKAFAALLLVGFAAARTKLMGYTNEDTPRIITGSNGIFDVSYTYNFEATYGTVFEASVDASDADINHESYAFNFDAYMTTAFTFDIAGIYTYKFGVSVDLLDVTPYRQIVSYVNPIAVIEGTKSFDVGASGQYDLYFAEVTTTSTHNTMVFTKSIADYLETVFAGSADATLAVPSMDDFELSDTDALDNTYYNWNAAEQFSFDSSSWYGTQQIWSASIKGTI